VINSWVNYTYTLHRCIQSNGKVNASHELTGRGLFSDAIPTFAEWLRKTSE